MPSQLWQRLRSARNYADLRQQDIADACNPKVSRGAVAQWESIDPNNRTTPSIEQVKEVAKRTDVPFEWLMDDDAEPEQVWFIGRNAKKAPSLEPEYLVRKKRGLVARDTEDAPAPQRLFREGAQLIHKLPGLPTPHPAGHFALNPGSDPVDNLAKVPPGSMGHAVRDRAVTTFKRAVEFQLMESAPELVTGFDATVGMGSVRVHPDFLYGDCVAEFVMTPVDQIDFAVLGNLLAIEKTVGKNLYKLLILWRRTTEDQLATANMEAVTRYVLDTFDVHVEAVRNPTDAALVLMTHCDIPLGK